MSAIPAEALSSSIEWTELAAGRWKFGDHITLGEARAALVPLEKLAWASCAHRTKVMNMEDNMVAAWAFAKGRSTSGGLNYLLRKRAALSAVTDIRQHLPWVDTERQPADKLSRLRPCGAISQEPGAPAATTILEPRRGVQL